MVTSYQTFIGTDIGKFKNVFTKKRTVEFDNNIYGWQQLFQKFSHILPKSLVTLENTGKYEFGLSHFLADKNIAVHRANNRKVKKLHLVTRNFSKVR